MSSDVHVIGMGNILFRDEGAGVFAAHYLRAAYRFTPPIDIADGATMGFGLMNYFQPSGAPARLIILDALLADDQPGAVYRLPGDQLIGLGPAVRPTAHEVDPIQLLNLATAWGHPPDMTLLGIVPADTTELAVGLTPQLRAAFPRYLNAALAELRACGIRADRHRLLSLDVIEDLLTCQP